MQKSATAQLPQLTVATIVEKDSRFPMVKEQSEGLIVYNQPAGHLEQGETLLEAAVRETLEETAWQVELVNFLGIYQYKSAENGIHYVRHCFCARPLFEVQASVLDDAIIEAPWLTMKEIKSSAEMLRSPLVLKVLQDYHSGLRYPLTLIAKC